MLRGGQPPSPEVQEAQKKIHDLNRELNQMTQQLQMNLVQRLQLKERIEGCMEQNCISATKNAERIIEQENKKRQEQKAKFVTTPDEFMQSKYSSVDSVVAVMDAEECMRKCQKGKDIMARVLE